MKRKIALISFVFAAAAVMAALGFLTRSSEAARYTIEGEAATPLGNAFTYQGHLLDAGAAPTGSYDLQFTLFDQSSAGIQIAGPITLDNVSVANGIFTVQLDFGSAAFNGDERFMAIGVRPGISTGAFTLLTTRSQITAAPYALYAKSAGVAASVTNRCPMRKFYMTSSFPQGNATITACVAGYHFASFSEIMDPSNLEYAQNGVDVPAGTAHTLPDSGLGPPFSSLAFIRVGTTGTNNTVAGNANCIIGSTPWSTNSTAEFGTVIALKPTWTDSPTNVSPWDSTVKECDNVSDATPPPGTTGARVHVWCVQD